jgi:hypothetical protein
VEHFAPVKYREHPYVLADGRKKPRMAQRPQRGKKQKNGGVFALRSVGSGVLARVGGSWSHNHAAVELALPPVQPAAGQFVARLERPDVLLTVAGSLGIQGPDDLGAVLPVARPMGHSGLLPAEAAGRSLRIMAFVPSIANQDELATDVAGRKLCGAAAAIVECLPGCGGKPAAGVGADDGHGDSHLNS